MEAKLLLLIRLFTCCSGEHNIIMLIFHFQSRDKAVRNRTRVAQSLDKLQHPQRQEAAKQRREEKKKQEKERMMNETDPEKTRKWEVSVQT